MTNRTYEWRPSTPRLGPASQRLYVNTLVCGWARPALSSKSYEWACYLPGLRAELITGKCDTLEAAQAACEKITKRWFEIADGVSSARA